VYATLAVILSVEGPWVQHWASFHGGVAPFGGVAAFHDDEADVDWTEASCCFDVHLRCLDSLRAGIGCHHLVPQVYHPFSIYCDDFGTRPED